MLMSMAAGKTLETLLPKLMSGQSAGSSKLRRLPAETRDLPNIQKSQHSKQEPTRTCAQKVTPSLCFTPSITYRIVLSH